MIPDEKREQDAAPPPVLPAVALAPEPAPEPQSMWGRAVSRWRSTSSRQIVIRASVWTLIGYGAGQALRFGSNLVLTRLLSPELFGLMALVIVFLVGLQLFSDIGIGTSIIRHKRGDDPVFLNTAWTMAVLRGLLLWICCFIIAVPASRFYEEPQLLWLLPLMGFSTLLSGLNSTALFTLNRHLAVRQLALLELGGQAASIVVMLTWAWLSPTIFALVAGNFASVIFQLAWSHRLNPGPRNRFAWDPTAVKEVVSFGKWVFLSTVMTFAAMQTDRLVLGKLLSMKMLGIYGLAFTLADIPRQIVRALSNKVIFPSFSKMSELPPAEFRAKIHRSRGSVLMLMGGALAVLVSVGSFLVSILYDDRYQAAAWMLPVLSMGVWPVILTQTIDPALLAIGKPHFNAYGSFLSFVVLAVGIPFGESTFGVMGAVVAISLAAIPHYVVINYGLYREGMACLGQDLKATAVFLGILALALAVRVAAGLGLPVVGAS